MQSVLLKPGVNLEPTPALNEAGISDSQLIRTKNQLTQTMGGWAQIGNVIPSTVRDLHAWLDTRENTYLAAGATQNLIVQQISGLTALSYADITPQTRFSSSLAPPNVSISSGSDVVTIVEPTAGLTLLDAVDFITPVSIGNLLLQGIYPVNTVLSTGSFTIISSVVSSTTLNNTGFLPVFNVTTGSAFVGVSQSNNTAGAILGLQQTYRVPTTVGGITISGPYNVASVSDSTDFTILSPTAGTGVATSTMNAGNAFYNYYVTPAPVAGALGYGQGPYGGGAYGSGATPAGDPGTPITATDWTMDNWGEILLSCPENGPVYQWSPNLNFFAATIVTGAPATNGGIFVSMPQQILVCWKSVQPQGNGGFNNSGTQDNLIVRWSDAQDFNNFDVSETTVAGSFHIPTGSIIRGGIQTPNYGMISTDIDVWIMQFVDAVTAFNFQKIGSGCGWIGKHACAALGDTIMWCGEQNIFTVSQGGVQVVPCTVWDFIFQQLNQANDANGVPIKRKVYASPNSVFNEMAWFFPTGAATENNAYVKINVIDNTWDKGFLTRTAWEDLSVVGNPMGADEFGVIYQHENGNAITGAGVSYFKTGWWAIVDGEELAFVDFVMPDMTWGTYGNTNGSVQITFYSVDYPGDTPRVYGPYTVTQANQYISPRIRGRLMSMQVQSTDNNQFWRLGRIRFRYAASGKR